MKDGYYLFTYLVVDDLACDYKIYLRHDQNISLWKKQNDKIELMHCWELERVTRQKQHYLPFRTSEQAIKFINGLLSEYGLSINDMVDIWGTPKLSSNNDYQVLCKYKEYPLHTISHLFSAILTDTDLYYKDKVLGFSVDAGPDWIVELGKTTIKNMNYFAGCIVDNGKIDVHPVITPGTLWLAATMRFQYREGTLMALASASRSLFIKENIELPVLEKPNDVAEVFAYIDKLIEISDQCTESDFGKKLNYFDDRFSLKDNKISMIMKIIQDKSIEIMDQNIQNFINTYHIDTSEYNLAIGGGYALNCPTNSYLMDKYKFKKFMAPPCVNDSGQSIGMALSYFAYNMDTFQFKLEGPYMGSNVREDKFDFSKYKKYIQSISNYEPEKAVLDIIDGPIVWCVGRSEIGPRALGHRSILADPRFCKSKDQVNIIKKRQWWRPVAPIILEDELSNWFLSDQPSPYMLCTYTVREDKREEIPAILHLDDSARVQTVNRNDEEHLYQLVETFGKVTGVPILCNTSLNDAGEPIVETIDESINFALRKKIKVIYFNNLRIVLCNFDNYSVSMPYPCNPSIDELFQEGSEQEKEITNPLHIPSGLIKYYMNRPNLSYLNLKDKRDSKMLKKFFQVEAKTDDTLYELFDIEKE